MFGPTKKNVSGKEFNEARGLLRARGFDKKKTDAVESFFRGDLNENGTTHRGIDQKEVEGGVKWLRENKSKHAFSDSQIDTIEDVLKKKL